MEEEKRTIIIGSRQSALAVAQTKLAADLIEKADPGVTVRIETMKTTGDRILDRPLDEIGGKGLFVKELDRALQAGQTDLSVHSLKDLPMEEDPAYPVLAYPKREDPRDALVLPEGACGIDFSKPIGTGSLRRILQIQKLYPQARFAPLRGNIITRLRKLDEGQYGAIILAAAGLKRMGLTYRISRYFEPDEVIPAAGQGILAVQGASGAFSQIMSAIDDEDSARAALCERAFVRALDGGCTSPAAAYAQITGEVVHLRGLYQNPDSGAWTTGEMTRRCADRAACAALGEELAGELRRRL